MSSLSAIISSRGRSIPAVVPFSIPGRLSLGRAALSKIDKGKYIQYVSCFTSLVLFWPFSSPAYGFFER